MAEYAELETEMGNLMDEADRLIGGICIVENEAAHLIQRLLDCANRAHDKGYEDGERQLRRTAADVNNRMSAAGHTA
jgi:hypothetical protein